MPTVLCRPRLETSHGVSRKNSAGQKHHWRVQNYLHASVWMDVWIYGWMYYYMLVYMFHIHIYIYTYTYVHTYICIYIYAFGGRSPEIPSSKKKKGGVAARSFSEPGILLCLAAATHCSWSGDRCAEPLQLHVGREG